MDDGVVGIADPSAPRSAAAPVEEHRPSRARTMTQGSARARGAAMGAVERRLRAAFLGYKLFRHAQFSGPVIVPFYLLVGVPLERVFVFVSVYTFAWAMAEVPSGILADRLGRRLILAVGLGSRVAGLLALFGAAILAETLGFPAITVIFVAGNIALGIGEACLSGADAAHVYDTLKAPDKDRKFRDISGQGAAVRHVSSGTSPIAGGFIASSLGLPLTVLFSAAADFIAALFVGFFPPARQAAAEDVPRGLTGAVREFWNTPYLRTTVIFLAAIAVYLLLSMFIIQAILADFAVDIVWFGLTFGAIHLAASVAAARNTYFMRWRRATMATALVAAIFAFLVLAAAGVWLGGTGGLVLAGAGFLLYGLVRGLAAPILLAWINAHCGSTNRAGVISIAYLLGTLTVAFGSPLFGYAVGWIGLTASLIAAALLLIPAGLVLIPMVRETERG